MDVGDRQNAIGDVRLRGCDTSCPNGVTDKTNGIFIVLFEWTQKYSCIGYCVAERATEGRSGRAAAEEGERTVASKRKGEGASEDMGRAQRGSYGAL